MTARAQLGRGALESVPLVVAAFPFGVVFGALAQSYAITFIQAIGMSAIVFAGASQFIALTLLASATAWPVIVFTVFVVNLRQMLYSANLMGHVRHWPKSWRAVLSFWLTDETFAVVSHRLAVASSQKGLRWFYLGSATLMYCFWLIATALGYLLGERMPQLANLGLDVAMIVAFVGIVVPSLKHKADWACAATASVSALLTYEWPHQTGLLFSALLAIAVALLLSRSHSE
ncbi:MAG: AzlC family ABC transporter permease [Pseudomonadota bacterium]